MELYDSFVRITYDPDGTALVLVDFGTPLWGAIEIDGQQVVQEQGFLRAVGIKAFPRGNERHSLRFEKAGIAETLDNAFADRLNGIIGLPRNRADLLLSLQDGRNWRIAHCAVRSWPGAMDGTRINRQGVEIVGGRLTGDAGVYAPGQTWGEISSLNWENIG